LHRSEKKYNPSIEVLIAQFDGASIGTAQLYLTMRHTIEPSQNCNRKPLPNVKIPQILTFLFNIYIPLIIKGIKTPSSQTAPRMLRISAL
jgi:hypothetical protein